MTLINRDRLYVHIPANRLIADIERFVSLGVNAEIFINSNFIDSHKQEDIELINKTFKKHNLNKIIHAPFVDLNPGSADSRIGEVSLERLLSALSVCHKLDAASMVMHSHIEPIFYGNHFKEWFGNALDAWRKIEDNAKKLGIGIFIENSIDEDTVAVLAILEKFDYFKACFDVAHYNVFSKKGWRAALKEYPSGSIAEVHLSDNRGEKDDHMALGEGFIDFEEFFKELSRRNEDPVFTIEPHTEQDLVKNLSFINKFIA